MRYKLVEEPEGTFAVIDTRTRKPADAYGIPAVSLDKEFAEDLQAMLESLDLRR